MIDNYKNGIHNTQDVLEYLASEYICDIMHKECGQIFWVADDLGINVGELEMVCDYLNINLENDFEI